MLLENKTAIIYGAGGAVGGAVAHAFAREGARLFLTGHRLAAVDAVAKDIRAAGGTVETAEVDALDERMVEEHASGVFAKTGQIDISFCSIAIPQPGIQGIPLAELSVEAFGAPIAAYTRANFVTARAAARRMLEGKAGVILMHTPEPARIGGRLVGGMGPAWAALEAMSRAFSAELGPQGIRAVCLRTTGMPETRQIGIVFDIHAKAYGISREQFQAMIEANTHRHRSTSLAELADVAAFIASDRASAMTGTVANLTGGLIVD